MFGKGTFKSSSNFRPTTSTAASNGVQLAEKISSFNEAEKFATLNESVKAVELYNKFLNEADNSDEGNCAFFV